MKQLNILLFGIGQIGSALVNKLIDRREEIYKTKNVQLNLVAIANSKFVFWNSNVEKHEWFADLENYKAPYSVAEIIEKFKNEYTENLLAIDATADEAFVRNYSLLIENGFHIVSANKHANTLNIEFYNQIRLHLKKYNRKFHYETHVGGGLPVLETIRGLQDTGDTITKVKGVFSGSLSYIFNTFSQTDISFSEAIKEAQKQGLTEPDVRDDLSGKDVARKLLIIARELGMNMEINDIQVESLIPYQLNGKTTLSQFNKRIKEIDVVYAKRKIQLRNQEVLRYIGEIDFEKKTLRVSLEKIANQHPLRFIQGSEIIVEIYSKTYQPQPLVIRGSGAGVEVTSNGLFKDVLRLSSFLPEPTSV